MQIVAYKKYIDPSITVTLQLPLDKQGQHIGTELATLADGLTYVSLPAAAKLPAQPKQIAASVQTGITLTTAQIAEIKDKSPHVALIRERVRQKIAERYSMSDEIKLLRLAPSLATDTYNLYVEDCRLWGQVELAKLGL